MNDTKQLTIHWGKKKKTTSTYTSCLTQKMNIPKYLKNAKIKKFQRKTGEI